MYIIATASADTYITNKIVDGSRAEDANVGRAGTLDLFKLYNETLLGSASYQTELSRILIKFDIERLRTLSSSSLDFSSPTFGAKLRLQQVETNLPVPRNFTVSVFPLARKFDEGDGRDVSSFADVDICNYFSASLGSAWAISGAYASGAVGNSGIDFFASGNLGDGAGLRSLESKQTFVVGTEDLFVDVTDIVSATLANIIPDYGMIIAFTSSQETDLTTRFVKRFASRHVTQETLRPRLEVFSNTTSADSHENAMFDVSGTLFLRNFAGSNLQNLMSSSIGITGSNSLKMILSTGSYVNTISASQYAIGQNLVSGTYRGSFYISAQDQTAVSGSVKLADHIAASGSIVFSETWKSKDDNITFLSTFLTCSLPNRSVYDTGGRQLNIRSTNTKSKYYTNSSYRVRVFAYDSNYEPSATKVPKPTKSLTPEMYYSIKDIEGNTYIPFEMTNGGTKLSSDTQGLFFDFYSDGLPAGKLLTFNYFVVDRGSEYVVEDKGAKFIVEK
jgi:hypothetical protein